MAVQWPRGRAPGFLSGPVCMPACPPQTPQKPTPKWRSYYGFYFPPELPAKHLKKRGLKKKGGSILAHDAPQQYQSCLLPGTSIAVFKVGRRGHSRRWAASA